MRLGAWIYNTTRVSKVEGSNPKYNADQRVFDDRWKQPGDIAKYKDIADSSRPDIYEHKGVYYKPGVVSPAEVAAAKFENFNHEESLSRGEGRGMGI